MTRHPRHPARSNGFTLLEMMAAVLVLSIIVVVVFPVVRTMISAHADSVSERAAIERVTFASDRVVRLIREIGVDDAGDAELATINAGELVLDDGSGVRLNGSDLELLDDSGTPFVLCSGVSAFSLTYLQADGQTATTDPALIWRVEFSISANSIDLSSAAFIRERIGGS